ncbi:MAG: hypothetical protein IPM64_11285 [Phycisphaerales bacterium]|nr:hypothetical protein [Phycisphaerales bacterium]
MADTPYARTRTVAIGGLILQVIAAIGLLMLGQLTRSLAVIELGWLVVGGVPIWFAAVLVFRQAELAELERMDIEELRREKQATGGGEAIFDSPGGGGFLVAGTRLAWMQRYLVPAFGVLSAAYLIGMGLHRWMTVRHFANFGFPPVDRAALPLAMIAIGVALLLMFLLSRFASGLGAVPRWQLMRACGSYSLGTVFAAMGVIVCLGAQLYSGVTSWEAALAHVLPWVMILIGAETLLNLIADIYRPRTAGVEPRAAFDSRLLGMFAEPGGFVAQINEAFNYQFGFQVSQTWFYQLFQRAVIPLAWAGALALWLLTSIVIVEPHEHAIVVSWGRQVNPDRPLGPGMYFKWPYPIESADIFNTQKLQQMSIGRKSDADDEHGDDFALGQVLQWTDQRHGGSDEFNFIIAPLAVAGGARDAAATDDLARSSPVHILRMTVAVQYRLVPERLAQFTQVVDDPHKLLRQVAWQELIRFSASHDALSLLGDERRTAGENLRGRIQRRLLAATGNRDVGLEVVYIGLQEVHPERSVATVFREVVSAEQEKLTAVRRALTDENSQLSAVAGDKEAALTLAAALDEFNRAQMRLDQALRQVETAGASVEPLRRAAAEWREIVTRQVQMEWARRRLELSLERANENIAMGLAASVQRASSLRAAMAAAALEAAEAATARDALWERLRREHGALDAGAVSAALAEAQEQAEVAFWRRETDQLLLALEGEAAMILAQAHARRWERELGAATQLVALQNQVSAFRAAPEVFRARAYWAAIAEGLKASRKYVYAFDATGRDVGLRVNAEEQARPDESVLTPR